MQPSRNYFDLFGLPQDYRLDPALLAERYRQAQKAVHPDRHAGGSAAEKRAAMQMATLVNTAHLTLKDSLTRAIYMLQLQGLPLQENPELPPALLMQQIEVREELEAIAQGGGPERLEAFRDRLASRRAALEDRFAQTIAGSPQEAPALVYELQFVHKLAQEASALEERLAEA